MQNLFDVIIRFYESRFLICRGTYSFNCEEKYKKHKKSKNYTKCYSESNGWSTEREKFDVTL